MDLIAELKSRRDALKGAAQRMTQAVLDAQKALAQIDGGLEEVERLIKLAEPPIPVSVSETRPGGGCAP